MNKLLVTLFAIVGLTMLNIEAGYRRYLGSSRSCGTSSCAPRCEQTCAPVCATACKVDYVNEEPCPALPCCERFVAVREPAKVTKNISYSVSCPDGCTEAQKNVGMMNAGDVWEQQQVSNDVK